jgi:Ca-activated chloride channel family protein
MSLRPDAVVAVLGALVLGAAGTHAAEGPSPREVNQAIDKGVDYLKLQQRGDGGWAHANTVGITALAGLALLESGVERDDPSIRDAGQLIRERVVRETQTYDLALAILFLSRMQDQIPGPNDDLIRRLARRLAGGGRAGMWAYGVPSEPDFNAPYEPKPYGPDAGSPGSQPPPETGSVKAKTSSPAGRRVVRRPRSGFPVPSGMALPPSGDNSNTQFALLGMWVASRHGFDADPALRALDSHFRGSQGRDGGWGYRLAEASRPSMSCAGLMGLAIWAARPKQEADSPQERGKALDKDPAFVAGLRAVTRDVRRAGPRPDIYYLWSLERVCVALGLRRLDGFDWYAAGARNLLDRQRGDGSWPESRWGSLPDTCLALLFLRKANLAYELNREITLPRSEPIEPPRRTYDVVAARRPPLAPQPEPVTAPKPEPQPQPQPEPEPVALAVITPPQAPPRPIDTTPPPRSGGIAVIVRQADEQRFPEITVDFEVKRPDGTPVLDALPRDFGVTEYDQPVEILRFQGPRASDPRPTTVVLVVDSSGSMAQEGRINALKAAVATFLDVMPAGSRVAVVAFDSEVRRICPFTSDPKQVQAAVNTLSPLGGTRYYDAVAEAIGLLSEERGRRAVLALTDGQDTASRAASLDSVILAARRAGLPVHTLGLGSEHGIATAALGRLATQTRGEYFPAREADGLRRIYEELARGLGSSYSLAYRTNRPLPDGTLRPIRIDYKINSRIVSSGSKGLFIPGMVVPAAGWSRLFVLLVGTLTALAVLPDRWPRRPA